MLPTLFTIVLELALSLALGDLPGRAAVAPRGGIHFIDVGQGSAALVIGPGGEAVLVDSGPASGAEAILAALSDRQVETLSLWVHSHFDADHLAGFGLVRRGLDGHLGTEDDIEVEELWDRGLSGPLPQTDALSIYASLAGERRRGCEAGASFRAPGLSVEALGLDAPLAEANENERGLALCMEVDGLRALFPGDLSATRVELAAQACGPVDLLWASHHGARDGTSSALLERADPRLTVISAGHENSHCHPAPLTLARLYTREVAILDGAGLRAQGYCEPIADHFGPGHVLVGGSLWVSPQLETWVGEPGGWTPLLRDP